MIASNPIDKEKILLKLDTFKLVVEANKELFESHPRLQEQLSLNMQMAQVFLSELDVWEERGDQMNYDFALESAKLMIADVQDLIHQILYD